MESTRLTDEQIDQQLRLLETADFPPDETVRLAEAIAHHAWGRRAEEGLERVLVELPRDRLNLLVSRHVMARPDSRLGPDYTGAQQPMLARKVEELGLPLYDGGDEWVSELPTGTKLNLEYGSGAAEDDGAERLDSKGEALARVALYAIWTRTMRARQEREEEG